MLVNFALDILGTCVSCDKVSTDGHECSNLIQTDYRARKNGYLAEHFVKPPVHVTFTFPCNINISHVVLEPFVGQQQSMQMELLCAHKPVPRTAHGKVNAQQKTFSLKAYESSNENNLPAFYTVSKLASCSRLPVCFYSSRFSGQRNHSAYPIKSEMRHSRSELLNSASHIMLKITRTLNSSIPALNGVEIWGCVSPSVNKEIRQMVESKYRHFVTPEASLANNMNPSVENTGKDTDSLEGNKNESERHKPVEDVPEAGDSFNIPEEFLDPLTWEVMTIPLLLPSGKNVDKSSLDRFSDSEASHGRRPRDPFTGVEFTDGIKPIPNIELKARIDAFLMSNSGIPSLKAVPRTLGTAGTQEKAGRSLLGKRKGTDDCIDRVNVSLLVKKRSECNKNTISSTSSSNSSSSSSSSSSSTFNSSSSSNSSNNRSRSLRVLCVDKPSRSDVVPQDSNESSSSLTVHHSGTSTTIDHPANRPTTDVGTTFASRAESHDARLKDSLDCALLSVLTGASRGPNFNSDSSSSPDKNRGESLTKGSSGSDVCCVRCGTRNSNSHNEYNVLSSSSSSSFLLYALPCQHTICRPCLLSLTPLPSSITTSSNLLQVVCQCERCGASFNKKDAVRAHC